MDLEGRDLKLGCRGRDVATLHRELRGLGYAVPASSEYTQRTAEAVRDFQRLHDLRPTGTVDAETARAVNAELDGTAPRRFLVRGHIRNADDRRPCTSGSVVALDRDMRSEQWLGTSALAGDGSYEIRYTSQQFQRAEKRSADLRVAVKGADAAGRPGVELASSPVIFNAGPVEIVDLEVGDATRRSEWERYSAELRRLTEGVAVAELTDDDITFLHGESRIPRPHLRHLRRASSFGRDTHLPAELFYGGLRVGLPASLTAWPLLPQRAIRQAVGRAIARNIVPDTLAERLDPLLEALRNQLEQLVIDPRPGVERPLVGSLLRTTGLDVERSGQLLALAAEHDGPPEVFWRRLREQPGFADPRTIADVQLTLQLGLLTGHSAPLVQAIRSSRRFGEAGPENLRDLTALAPDELAEIVAALPEDEQRTLLAAVAGEDDDERRDRYVRGVLEVLEMAFPTTFLARAVARPPEIDLDLVRELKARNPGIDLAAPIPRDLDWGGVEPARARASLTALRREMRAYPGFDPEASLGSGRPFENRVREGVSRFFDNEPDFELAEIHIDRYLEQRGDGALAGIAEDDRPAVVTQLKLLQRLHRIAPRYEQMEALAGEGLYSAQAVANVPRSAFLSRFAGAFGGEAAAARCLETALQISGANTLLSAFAYQEAHGLRLHAIHGPSPPEPGADWPSLFGPVELCECRHCRSVYSPAAYLVDLLEFLRHSGRNAQGWSPLEVLIGKPRSGGGRRPDLAHILLSCDNTLTTLPYVDLVNEILEFCVAHDGALDETAAHDTAGLTADELSLNPQHTDRQAYERLQAARYPIGLPFHRPLEIARAYLDHLGIRRHRLMDAFLSDSPTTAFAVAAESLSLSPQEAEIVTGRSATPLHELYGFDDDSSWTSEIAAMPELLRRTGLEYGELLELLECRFVNPQGEPVPSGCELSNLELEWLDEAALARIQRFVRLRRRIDLSPRDLDRLLLALGATALDEDGILVRLQQALELRQQGRKLEVAELAALWGAIDTHGEHALYGRLFQNPAVIQPVDDTFALNEDGSELAQTAPLGPDHVPTLLAALRIDELDYETIRAAEKLEHLDLASLSVLYRHAVLARHQRLSVADLIAFKKLSGLDPFAAHDPASTVDFVEALAQARGAGFSVAQLGYLYRHLTAPERGIGPRDEELRRLAKRLAIQLRQIAAETEPAPDPAGERTRTALAALWEPPVVEQMMGILNGTGEYRATLASPPALHLSDDAVSEVRYGADERLRVKGVLSAGEKALLSDLSGDAAFLSALETLFEAGSEGLHDAEAVLTAAPELALPAGGQRLAYTAGVLRIAGPLTVRDKAILLSLSTDGELGSAVEDLYQQPRAFLRDAVASLPDAGEAEEKLLDHPLPAADRFGYLLEPLLRHLRETGSRSLVVRTLAARTDLDDELAAYLLETHLRLSAGDDMPLIDHFLVPECPDQTFAEAFTRLDKAALLAGQLELDPELLAYLADHASDFGGFELNLLPLDRDDAGEVDDGAPDLFAAWRRIERLSALRRDLAGGDADVVELFQAATESESSGELTPAVKTLLGELTAWPVAEIEHLADEQGGFGLSDDDLRNETQLLRLRECMAIRRRLGVSTVKLLAWADPEPLAATADDIVHTTKAKYSDEQWAKVAKPLNDRLRDLGREALVASLTTDLGLRDADQLLGHFLIDVSMSSCMKTSRIKLAISSVQLFIQRCLMDLERGKADERLNVSPDALDAERWKWMKNYRVWEANRKVFLYPENWIEPELRDGKTPFFQQLESELLQGELTEETAERALVHYLEKLEDVSRLEIVGLHWQKKELVAKTGTAAWSGDGYTGLRATHEFERRGELRGDEILHVFGRTRHAPHRYFYRRLDIEADVWTPWEPVELDIASDDDGVHLIPVVFNRRLHLFWPLFEEKTGTWGRTIEESYLERVLVVDDTGPGLPWPHYAYEQKFKDVEEELTASFWQIKLAWSEYREGGWTPKKVASHDVAVGHPWSWKPEEAVLPEKRHITFGTSLGGDVLRISVNRYRRPRFNIFDALGVAGRDDKLSDEPQLGTVAGEPPDELETYGFFWMDGCRSELHTWPPPGYAAVPAPTRYHAPWDSTIKHMSFEQDLSWKGDALENPTLELRLPNPAERTAEDPFFRPIVLPQELLGKTPERFRVVFPHGHRPLGRHSHLGDLHPFLYQDLRRTYCVVPWHHRSRAETAIRPWRAADSTTLDRFIKPSKTSWGIAVTHPGVTAGSPGPGGLAVMSPELEREYFPSETDQLRFSTFFHPHVCTWLRALNRDGIPALFTLENQELSHDDDENVFEAHYDPSPLIHSFLPKEDVDFSFGGAYSVYNWEVFFHAPMLLATRLTQDQQFEQAQRFFHYVFDPTSSSAEPTPRRYWNVLPFYDNAHPERHQIQKLFEALSGGYPGMQRQVKQWRDNPFNPHLIARLRITAYQKNVVMKYLDNLIAWADKLFLRDSFESINEATQLYILAANILGPRPQRIPAVEVRERTYAELREEVLDDFSNALVRMENDYLEGSWDPEWSRTRSSVAGGAGRAAARALPGHAAESLGQTFVIPDSNKPPAESLGRTFYFCIPDNDKLLGYWDTVADRLFKIRHCMNIEGVVRELPLFEPPIDPGLLVQAVAKGVDISSVLDDLSAPLGPYRFPHVLQRALELCGELESLGGALLQALEKKDAESLAAIRAGHETGLLKAVREIRKSQIQEARRSREALEAGKEVIVRRRDFYQNLVDNRQRIGEEEEQIDQLSTAQFFHRLGQQTDVLAASLGATPQFTINTPVPTSVDVSWGHQNIMNILQASSRSFGYFGSIHSHRARLAEIEAGWARRLEGWQQELALAERELAQTDKQIAAAEIREQIAQLEFDNHERQIDNASEIEDRLRRKYTNEQLYTWMVTQTSQVFFQTYKLAYETAKRAERAYRFELGIQDSSFVQFGYWDSLREGLLAGEQLGIDLRRMEASYLEKNRRSYEITKHVSLVLHDPLALIALKQSGECEVELPELLFDADYRGHYFRRIKSVSLSIPSVTGPYTSINCTLTLLASKIRTDPGGAYAEDVAEPDDRFLYNFTPIERIATSHGQNDSGMFELNFRDERYLPFEGAGAVSRWRVELPRDCNAFDFDTITDVVLTMSYTARDGGAVLAEKARKERDRLWEASDEGRPRPPLQRLFSLRHEFPDEWSKFLSDAGQDGHQLAFTLTPERFPYRFRGRDIEVDAIYLFVQLREEQQVYEGSFDLEVGPGGSDLQLDGEAFHTFPNRPMPYASPDVELSFDPRTSWLLRMANTNDLEDLWMVLGFGVSG